MSSSVKAKTIFPSISITKKKGKTGSGATPQTPNAQSLPFLRPLTPESIRKQAPPSPNEPGRSFPARGASPAHSPSLSRWSNSGETNLSALENGYQLSQSTPDLRIGYRQVRSVSQPVAAATSHRESFSSVTLPDRSNSVNSDTSYYAEAAEVPMIVQEDIIALTCHVRTFSEALSSLRNTFIECEDNPDDDPPEVKAHERLGEVLSVLKGVLNIYQPLHSTDILASAGTLISKVKSHNYKDTSKAPDEFYESIDQLALAFSSSVSDFLMGDQDMVLSESTMSKQYSRLNIAQQGISIPPESVYNVTGGRSLQQKSIHHNTETEMDKYPVIVEPFKDSFSMANAILFAGLQSLEDFGDEEDEDVDDRGYEEDNEDDQDYLEDKDERKEKRESVDTSAEKADELDKALIQLEHGVDIAMQRTKIWAKYSKDIETYVDKRAHLELEYTAKLAKLAQTTKAAITEENYLPFQSIFVTALDQDIDYAENANKTYASLMSSRFMEPLTLRRNQHEKTRKDLKEGWAKALKKVNEAMVNLKKAKAMYIQKQQELEKEGGSKKKQGELRKADEAEELYKSSVVEANARQRELESTKSNILVELRQLVYQCDQTMKAVTCNYFQMMNALASPAPVQFQTLAESSRNYEPGNQFAEFVRLQQANSPKAVEQVYHFEPYTVGFSDKGQQTPTRHNSIFDTRHSQTLEENSRMSPFNSRRHKSLQLHHLQHLNSSQQPMNAWSHLKEHHSDAESTTSRSLPGSPSHSPTSSRKQANIQRAQSLELVSSDDGENKDDGRSRNGPVKRKRPPKNRSSAGPFQNTRLSSSAQTHTLKKLRSASKCRECDSYVYFNGAECEVCGLTCHKKCLGRLNIKCGAYNKIQRRMTTFGVDFYRHLQDSNTEEENIPHIISSCIDEIDKRGLDVKGIYRVSGVKSRVEKLCQSFENGEYQADLSDTPPHVIAAVLKLYLRQLPESLLTVKLYPEFIRIARESFALINNSTTCKDASENEDIREDYDKLISKLREVVMQLPTANRVTAARVIMHLRRVSEHDESNAMPGSNLAIVFGPTLLRPSENEATSTLSSLVDMPHQTRLVELLIASPEVFELPEVDVSLSRETPVEKFTPPKPREREGSLVAIQSVRPAGNNPDESYEAEDEASLINTPDTNSSQPSVEYFPVPRSSSSPASMTKPRPRDNVPQSPSPSTRSSLGFGSEFFELLAKSNSRSDGQTDRSHYSIPEFLVPESPHERPVVPRDDSDMEDEFEDDTTQGTSGSRTPDNDHDSSQFGASRRIKSPRSSNENLAEDDKINLPHDSSYSVISPSSSLYSFAPSFSSDFPDTDSLLPDLSDINTSGSLGLSDKDTRLFDDQSDLRTRLLSGNTGMEPRRRTFGLLKRNSDLPGRVQRVDDIDTGFCPIGGMKTSSSDTNLKKDPYGIDEEVCFITISDIASSSSNTVTSIKSDELEKDSLTEEDNQTSVLNKSTTTISIDTNVVPVPQGGGVSPLVSSKDVVSPLPSPTKEKIKEKELASPTRVQSPPVAEKPVRSPSIEKKDFDVSITPAADVHVIPVEEESRELIIPVMTALQERRPSTPNCSTEHASTDSITPDRVESPVEVAAEQREVDAVVNEKKSDSKPKTRSAYTTRVSVKDRRQQYERNRSPSVDSNRKNSTELFNPNSVASRKQLFEQRERGMYKRISEMGTRKPMSDSGSGSGSASGSPKLLRKRLIDGEDGRNEAAAGNQMQTKLEKTKSSDYEKHDEARRRNRKDKSENTERPRSLILDRLRLDSMDSLKPERQRGDSLKLDLHDSGTLSPREIDIPLDTEDFDDKHRSERPRRSPNTSPRSSRTNVRSPFPEDGGEEDREPQFV